MLSAGKENNLSSFQKDGWWECDNICLLPKNPNRGGLGEEEEKDVTCISASFAALTRVTGLQALGCEGTAARGQEEIPHSR